MCIRDRAYNLQCPYREPPCYNMPDCNSYSSKLLCQNILTHHQYLPYAGMLLPDSTMLWDIVDTIPKPYRKNRLLKNNLQDGRNRFRYSCRHQCMSGRFSFPPDNSILPSHTAGQQQVFQRPPSVYPIKFKGKIKDTQGILKLPFLKILFAFLNQRIDIRIFCRSHHFHYALPMFINLQVPLLFKWNLPLIEAQF